MPLTYTLIASASPNGTSDEVQFSSIPATFDDLSIRASVRIAGFDTLFRVFFNNISTGDAWAIQGLRGIGSAGASANNQSSSGWFEGYRMAIPSGTSTALFTNWEIYIANYSVSDAQTITYSYAGGDNNNTSTTNVGLVSGVTKSSMVLNDIRFRCVDATPQQSTGSHYYLYGIKRN